MFKETPNSLTQNENASNVTHSPNRITHTNNKVYDTKECSICMEEITPTNRCVTQCGHQFCLSCMFQVIDASQRGSISCPICRADVHKFKRNQRSISYQRLRRLNTRIGIVTQIFLVTANISDLKNILSIPNLNQVLDGLNISTKWAIRDRFNFWKGFVDIYIRNVNNNIIRFLGNR